MFNTEGVKIREIDESGNITWQQDRAPSHQAPRDAGYKPTLTGKRHKHNVVNKEAHRNKRAAREPGVADNMARQQAAQAFKRARNFEHKPGHKKLRPENNPRGKSKKRKRQ